MKPASMLPAEIKSLLWSYDTNKIDISQHKRIIISQVLNFGTENAIRWLFKQYGTNEITKEANQIPLGQWDKKSLSLWSLVLGIKPVSKAEKLSKMSLSEILGSRF